MNNHITRRSVLASGAGMAALMHGLPAQARYVSDDDEFNYEVTRSDAEWRARLGDDTYHVMRLGHTEPQGTSPLWNSLDPGMYHCKGCDLPVYDARWKVITEKQWLFFRHGEVNALMMGIDWPDGAEPDSPDHDSLAAVETHCRRCGSHMGHIVTMDSQLLHCINGSSLNFEASA